MGTSLLDLFGWGALMFEMNYPAEPEASAPPVPAVPDEPETDEPRPVRRKRT